MKDGEIKNKLSPAQVSVMLHRVTEPPYFGKFWDHFEPGTYRCAACETPLFSSDEKFDSRTGWPSFKKPISERDLQFKSEAGPDDKIELRCKKCRSHLGYVISGEAPYYRLNSVCLLFEKREIPVVPVLAATEAPKNPPEKKTEAKPAVIQETAAVPIIGWTTGSLIAASVIAFLVGMLGTYLYQARVPLQTSETSTTTSQIATSTDATDTPVTAEDTPAPKKKAVAVPPVEPEPQTPVAQTLDPQNTATSTQ